jgi:uncharacterized protein YbjT (DUF2867 family)
MRILVVAGSPVPHTVMRATPFHEFVAAVARRGRLGRFVVVPRLRTNPVAAADVAAALADVVGGPPRGRTPDIGGPREEQFVDLVRKFLTSRGDDAMVVPVVWPGRAGRAMRDGAQMSAGGQQGRRTFEQWLAEQRLPHHSNPAAGR